MADTFDLFLALAEISGVFVGFGALIGIGRRQDIDSAELATIRSVVAVGLVVIVAALVPVLLARYAVDDFDLWRLASLVFLAIIWVVILSPLRSPQARDTFLAAQKANPIAAAFFWLILEVSIQLPLVFNLIGFRPELAHAFYTTAVVISLVEAAFLLAAAVLSDPDTT